MGTELTSFREKRFVVALIAENVLDFGYAMFVMAFLLSIIGSTTRYTLAVHVFGMGSIGYFCSLLVGGYVTSRFGFKRAILAAMAIYAAIPPLVYYGLASRGAILLLAFISGTTSGLSKPGAQVQFYDMMPKEKRSRLYLALYLLSLLSTTGYLVGAALWRLHPGLPFWCASFCIAVATVLYRLAPSQECAAAGEAQMTFRDAWRLLREYVNPKFRTVVATMCILSAGNAVFYYGGMIRMLQTETPGIRISTVTAAVLIMGVVSQFLRKSSLPKMLMMLAGVPVICLAAAACYSVPVVVMVLWTLFMGLSFAAQLEIIGQLDSFVEVRSGISMSLYQLASSVGCMLSYMMVAVVGSWFNLRWIYVAYGIVFCSLFFILPRRAEPAAPEAAAHPAAPAEDESVRPREDSAPESMDHVETYVRS